MVEVTAQIDAAAVARLDALFQRIEREMPRRMGTQIQRAAVYICRSARRKTKVAPKRITMKNTAEYIAVPSPADSSWPKYLFYYGKKDKGRSGKRARPLHLWKLTRKVGTPKQYSHDHYVYTKAHRGKGGNVVGGSKTQEIRELLKIHGGITRYGLAKKSWGWLAHDIYKAGASGMGDLSWKRTKGERRNPRDDVKGLFSQLQDGASATLQNRLDYILDACPESAISEAIIKATNQLEHNLFPQEELERMAQ